MEISKVLLSPAVQYPPTTNSVLNLIDNNGSSKKDMEKEFVHRFGMLKGQRMVGYLFTVCFKNDFTNHI